MTRPAASAELMRASTVPTTAPPAGGPQEPEVRPEGLGDVRREGHVLLAAPGEHVVPDHLVDVDDAPSVERAPPGGLHLADHAEGVGGRHLAVGEGPEPDLADATG